MTIAFSDSVSRLQKASTMPSVPLHCCCILIFRCVFCLVVMCTDASANNTHFELEFYRLTNPNNRIAVLFQLSSRSVGPIAVNGSRLVHVVICLTDGLSTIPSIDQFQSESDVDRVRVTRIACALGNRSADMMLAASPLNASLIVYVPRSNNTNHKPKDSGTASVMAHNANRTILRLNLNSHDRLYRWFLSSQPIYARLGRRFGGREDGPDHLLTDSLNATVINLRRQLAASQIHTDRSHVTMVMIYVLLIFFTLFVLTGVLGLVGYLLQRLRHVHIKRRCSRHLVLATRKALKKLPLRTLRPSDMEVSSGCDQCAVCIELYKASDVIRILPCRHFYHKKCIDPWLLEQRSCPLCKLDILKSCGIMLGLSAEDESYLATRLVERDSDSLSSSSSSSVSIFSYPMGWQIKRFMASVMGKNDSSHLKCDACSRAYTQAMQLNALPFDDDSRRTIHSLIDGGWPTHLDVNESRNVSFTLGPSQPHSTRVERQSNNPPNAAVSILSWICSCLCWWRTDLRFSDKTLFNPHLYHHRTSAYHATESRLDMESSQALHAARLLCYRDSSLADQLCFYHASVLGLQPTNLSCTPYTAHWTQYATHCAAIRKHWHDSRVSHQPAWYTSRANWFRRLGLKSASSTNPLDTEQPNYKHREPCIGRRSNLIPSNGSNLTRHPPPTSAFCLSDGKGISHTHTEALMAGKTEQTVVIHHVMNENSASADQTGANSDGWVKSGNVAIRTDAHSATRYTPNTTTKLDEYQGLSVLPPISVTGTHSSLSSDGSSEPSLVVLPSTSVRDCINPLGTFWSQLHNSTVQITPPTYLESGPHLLNDAVDADAIGYTRPQAKIRSRKFRGGYHPYFFPGTGRRGPIHVYSESKNNHSSSTNRGSDKVPRNSPWRLPFTTSMVGSESLLNRLSKLFCSCHPKELSPIPSDLSFEPHNESVKSASINPLVNLTPNYFSPPGVLHDPMISTHMTKSPRTQPQSAISLPQANITCPLCRLELRQVVPHVHQHNRCNPIWRRMFQVHPFNRHGSGSLTFTQSDRSARKHPHHCRYQQQRHKTPPCSRTAVHVHSYELQSVQPHRVPPGISDDVQTVNSDSSETNVETTTIMSARLRGVRVTVEPPEVQYHNGPLTSDSSSSPIDSYHAEDSFPGSDVSHSSTHPAQHEIAVHRSPVPSSL